MPQPIYFRRCHICQHLNETTPERANYCQRCSKSLSRFFYFDERILIFFDNQNYHQMDKPLISGQYRPIQGLTAFWD